MKMARFFTCLAVLVIAFISFNVFQNKKLAKAAAAETQRVQAQAARKGMERSELSQRHNAFAISERALSSLQYTVQFQRALMPTNNQPILFTAELDDVFEDSGILKIRLILQTHRFDRVFFELECPETLGNPPRMERWRRPKFNVVAVIETVKRPLFEASAVSDGDVSAIEVESATVFIAKGRCIEFKALQ